MTRTMYDVAFLPVPTPAGYDIAAGYVYQAHHEAANIWTSDDWRRAAQRSRWLLPIATCWPPFGDAHADAAGALAAFQGRLHDLGLSWRPCAVALDVEAGIAQAAHDAGYIDRWRAAIREAGCYDVVYSSRSTALLLGAGPKWIAFGRLGGDVVIVQTGQTAPPGVIDTDTAAELVPFYDTAPPAPPPGGGDLLTTVCAPYSSGRTGSARPAPAFGAIVCENGAGLEGDDGHGVWVSHDPVVVATGHHLIDIAPTTDATGRPDGAGVVAFYDLTPNAAGPHDVGTYRIAWRRT